MRAWLVSGDGIPTQLATDSVELVGAGSAGDQAEAGVSVPLVPVDGGNAGGGRIAWWTGDLGQRANLAVVDAHGDRKPNPDSPGDGGYFRMMASQQADSATMENGQELSREVKEKLASGNTVALPAQPGWARDRFFDFTVDSAGVLADPLNGGLKKDLTAYSTWSWSCSL